MASGSAGLGPWQRPTTTEMHAYRSTRRRSETDPRRHHKQACWQHPNRQMCTLCAPYGEKTKQSPGDPKATDSNVMHG
jgi:hypothetical protein